MFHDSRELKTIASRRLAGSEASALAAIEAFCAIGIESAVLSKKLLDNAQKMWLSSETHKDAEDASRAMAAFVNASCRDMSENAEAIARIWRRFVREAFLTGS